jgi:hypothetical protein
LVQSGHCHFSKKTGPEQSGVTKASRFRKPALVVCGVLLPWRAVAFDRAKCGVGAAD